MTPAQQRAERRLDALLDTAAEIVDDVGAELITTAQVAERSGASIGTVYRYFPDRLAVLRALRERCVQRFRDRLAAAIGEEALDDPWHVVERSVVAAVDCYRHEPGFRVVRVVERDRSVGDDGLLAAVFADDLAAFVQEHFGLPADSTLRRRFDVAIEVADSLMARAFAADPAGDEWYIDECLSILREYLGDSFGLNEEQARATSVA
ncbi:TetR/AcrR family transcriptional regulator [Agromyces rhizosphaerae]|uniref:TetR/AcrR family transcriptional regulator n=1 Tax=Agromyces rhizosphaerae TaxID=88374 RepID=UPI002492898D|nr:TetR/AcrR family transcriptional regulator [Agromyces rhizosphaerae]